jgi:hypothetical protein
MLPFSMETEGARYATGKDGGRSDEDASRQAKQRVDGRIRWVPAPAVPSIVT